MYKKTIIILILIALVFCINSCRRRSTSNIEDTDTSSVSFKQKELEQKERELQEKEQYLKEQQTPSYNKTSDAFARDFINALGSQNFYKAYSIIGGERWGTYNKFSSIKAYGGITRTYIHECYVVRSNDYEATVYVDYDSYDPFNNDGRYKQYFNMYKAGDEWFIKKIDNVNIIYYRKN